MLVRCCRRTCSLAASASTAASTSSASFSTSSSRLDNRHPIASTSVAVAAAHLPLEPAKSKRSSPKSTSQCLLPDGTDKPKTTRRGPRRKALHKLPPSTRDPRSDPLSILDTIRTSPPTSSPLFPDSYPPPTLSNPHSINQHNKAVHSILSASGADRKNPKTFQTAFVDGWRPIRKTRQAGRLDPHTLGKVLQIAGEAVARGDPAVEWEEIKELAVFLSAEHDMPGVALFCWKLLGNAEGARRVIELVKSLTRDAAALRARADAPDVLSRTALDGLHAASTSDLTTKRTLIPARVLGAYVAAHAVLHHLEPTSSPSPREVLPTLLVPPESEARYSKIKSVIPTASNSAATSFFTSIVPHLPEGSKSLVMEWLRQADLAQTWTARPNGVQVIQNMKLAFRRGGFSEVLGMWEAIKGAVGGEVRWLGVEEWEASAGRRWVDGRLGMEREEAEERKERGLEGEEKELKVASTTEQPEDGAALESATKTDTPSPVSATSPSLPVEPSPNPPMLLQAHIAVLLQGFTRARKLDHANAVWSWLSTTSPPLTPGVVAWTGLLSGYACFGEVAAVESAWDSMTKSGVQPDIWAWAELASAYFYAKDPKGAMKVFETMLRAPELKSSWKDEGVARLVYDRFVGHLLAAGDVAEARALIGRGEEVGVKPNVHTINLFLRHYTFTSKPDLGGVVECLQLLGDRDMEPDVFTFTIVLQSLLKSGTKQATGRLVKIMEDSGVKPSISTYGSIIHNLTSTGQARDLTAAVELLDELENRRIPPNEIVYTSLIQGFLRGIAANPSSQQQQGDTPHPYFNAALALNARRIKHKIPLNRFGYNSIITAALALQNTWGNNLALSMFRDLEKATKDRSLNEDKQGVVAHADSWFVIIEGFAKMGNWSMARELVTEMEASGFEVRSRSLSRLVNTVRRGGWY